MGYGDAVLLAVLQGLTEFLPVSSSGHLVLAQSLYAGADRLDLAYNVAVHLGTAAALLLYFRQDVAALWIGLWRSDRATHGLFAGRERHTLGCMLVALIPTALVGLGIDAFALPFLTRSDVVGGMLLVTGGMLWWGRGTHGAPRRLGVVGALVIGLLQGAAVAPGLSRSGVTISAGVLLGLDRETAARFSLLISVPAILGAALLQVAKLPAEPLTQVGPYLAGMLVAGAVGYGAIAWILRLVQRDRFHVFVWYVWPLGGLAILSAHLGG